MTLVVLTISHGELECGFQGGFTQFFRFGEYTFATKHLCEIAKQIADDTSVLEGKILAYDVDKFWEKNSEYIGEMMEGIGQIFNSYLPKLHRVEFERKIESKQGKVSIEDEYDFKGEGEFVPIKIKEDEVILGDYTIPVEEFAGMCFYTARGGFFGWMNGAAPDFAEETMIAIKNSKNPLYVKFQGK